MIHRQQFVFMKPAEREGGSVFHSWATELQRDWDQTILHAHSQTPRVRFQFFLKFILILIFRVLSAAFNKLCGWSAEPRVLDGDCEQSPDCKAGPRAAGQVPGPAKATALKGCYECVVQHFPSILQEFLLGKDRVQFSRLISSCLNQWHGCFSWWLVCCPPSTLLHKMKPESLLICHLTLLDLQPGSKRVHQHVMKAGFVHVYKNTLK